MGSNRLTGPSTRYIASVLSKRMSTKGMTLDQLAAASGVSRSTADRAMKGESALAVEIIFPLCAALDIDAIQLLAEAQERSAR